MADFADLDDMNFDLLLPWRGREWLVVEPTAKESERLRTLVFTDAMNGTAEVYEYRKLLGQTWNDLIDAGIGWSQLMHFSRAAMIWFTTTPEAAQHYWHLGKLVTLVDLDMLDTLVEKVSA